MSSTTAGRTSQGTGSGLRAGRLARWARGVGVAGFRLLFPRRCAWCDAELPEPAELPDRARELLGVQVCGECEQAMVPAEWSACGRCAAPRSPWAVDGAECPACRGSNLKFHAAVALGRYEELLREAVLRMKRYPGEPLAAATGCLLWKHRAGELGDFGPDLVVPVPVHWRRRFQRASNSPEVVAAVLGRGLGVPVRRLLVRWRATPPQAALPVGKRFENVRGAFRIRRRNGLTEGASVLLVDDILTTGATCSEAAGVLKRAGAARVMAVVIARASRPGAT